MRRITDVHGENVRVWVNFDHSTRLLRVSDQLTISSPDSMRPREYVVLAHFNVMDAAVKVDGALESGGTKISVTKTPAGRRTIDLSPESGSNSHGDPDFP